MKKKTSVSSSKLSVIILIELVLGFVVSLASLLVFLKIAFSIETIHVIDESVNTILYQLRTPLSTDLMVFFSAFGYELLLVFLVVLLIILVIKKYYRDAVVLLIMLVTGTCFNIVIKEVVSRDRPAVDPLFQELLHSFPSLHATNSFVFYSFIVYLIYKITRNRFYTVGSFLVGSTVVVLVGISRIYLGVHYLSDVIAGFVFGLWWIATVLVIDKTISVFGFRNRSHT